MLRKKIIVSLVSAALLTASAPIPVYAENEQTFEEFETQLFKDYMEDDYLSLHFGLRNYEKYGIEKPEPTLGRLSWSDYQEDKEDAEELLETLHAFDYDSLSDTEKVDYQAIETALNNTVMLNKYPYFDFGFNDAEGIVSNLITNFTEFVLYEKQDIDDYLSVLDSVPQYMDDALAITEKQAKEGYFLTDLMLDDTLDSIDRFVEKTDDNELIRVFEDNLEEMRDLTDDEKEEYKKKNREIVLNAVIPCYKKAGEKLESLRGSRNGGDRVCDLENGEAYYTVLAQNKTSLSVSVEEMLDDCTDYLNDVIYEYVSIISDEGDDLDESIELESPEEVLEYLRTHMDDFPEGPEVTYKATYLDPSIANDSIVAYYMQPPIDDLKDNVIKINGGNISDTNELFSTLAHEGFPGHLYQITYYLNTNPAPIRTQLSAMGYQEGWGMYSEMEALDTSPLSKNTSRMLALDTALGYVMDAAVDLGVNGLGWTEKDVAKYLDQLGLNEAIAESLYEFVTSRPGTILPYGVGLAEFELMKADTKKQLGSAFDEKEFHTVLLDNGSRPFAMVQADLDSYIKEKTEGKPAEVEGEKTETEPEAEKPQSGRWISIGGIVVVGVIVIIIAVRSGKKKIDDEA